MSRILAMFKRFIVIVFLLTVFQDFFSQSAICAYSYRKRITVDPTKVSGSSDLTNFPMLINIASDNDLRTTANSGHVRNSNGYDIVFTSADGVTLLSFQLERYVATTGQITVWVKVPALSTFYNTYIYMYYGNSSITTDQSSTATWSGYHGVWHFQNNSFVDWSGNAYSVTNYSTTNQSPAVINDGRASTGTQWMELNSFPDLNTNFSISAWAYTTDNTKDCQRIFCDDEGVVAGSAGYALTIGDAGPGSLVFFSRACNPVSLMSGSVMANNTWYHVTGVADINSAARYIYVNGVLVAATNHIGSWGTDSGHASIGGEIASGETTCRLRGRLDEVKIAKTALSADWVATEYNNQVSPSTFYTVSPEPAVFTGSSSTSWTTAANWSSGAVPSASADVILSASTNQASLNTSVQLAALWVRPSNTITIGSNLNLRILFDITACGVVTGANANSQVEFNSSSAHTQTEYMSGSGTFNLNDLTVNNTFSANPSLVLKKDINVANDLVLTSGIVSTTSTNILALGNNATSTSGSSASYVSGPMSKSGTAAFIFPVGKNNAWRRIAISSPSVTSVFRAEYFRTAYSNTASVTSPLTNISQIEYWQLDRLSGTGSANVGLYWESALSSGINNCPDLTVARWNGSSWTEMAATTNTGSTCSGSGTGIVTTTAAVTAFSPFTFGSKTLSLNPLPVELKDFTALCEGSTVKFKWTTESEKFCDYFAIEFSADGNDWEELIQVKGAGNSSTERNYNWQLESLTDGYYRLTEVDMDKTRNVFKVLYPSCKELARDSYKFSPNPAKEDLTLSFKLQKPCGDATILIIDQLGKIVVKKTLNLLAGQSDVHLSLKLTQGVYVVRVLGDALDLPSKKLIIE